MSFWFLQPTISWTKKSRERLQLSQQFSCKRVQSVQNHQLRNLLTTIQLQSPGLTYIRMLRPLYSSAKVLTDFKEPKSRCITSTVAWGDSICMVSLIANPSSNLWAMIATCATCNASTLVVSFPNPDVAPTQNPTPQALLGTQFSSWRDDAIVAAAAHYKRMWFFWHKKSWLMTCVR